ncbi:Eco57I restriction-modification methylase domain-containing protein [Coleofasciculus sp. F4-SAH-05]|uniref:Eco57I restriction-modification methylase domain-containing protein n=1 Tax=Coleofasciculus sp. F4-SAH-05 TaxID=3069525 RepID=UPI0033034C15
MPLNFKRTRDLLYDFQFHELFIEELGWYQPSTKKAVSLEIEEKIYQYQRIAEASGVVVFEVTGDDGKIPEAKHRVAIHKELTEKIAENLLIFVDKERSRSLWYWVKREESKRYVRDHLYVKGQPGDLFLSKLGGLVIDISHLEDGEPSVIEVAQRLQSAFDIERVTKKFYHEFQEQHQEFLRFIQGIDSEADSRWYTSVILNRLMFVYFLQKKGFIDNEDGDYLHHKLAESKQRGENRFFREFLQALFFEGFAKPEFEREPEVQGLIGRVNYLNGGLFLQHRIEQEYPHIDIADEAFEQILDLFSRYSWNLDDTPGGKDDEINPDVLGYIFEKYINQKAFGAYYTRPEITEYLCDRTINKLILDRVNATILGDSSPSVSNPGEGFTDINELLIKLDSPLCDRLIQDILPNLSLLDPACGSGAFLVAAMKTLISVYTAVIGTIKLKGDRRLKAWLNKIEANHPSLSYFVKKRIITDNLYGVDIMEEATEIAKLRLFLALVSSAQEVEELEPLPNIDFNIMVGNSLIGLIRVDEEGFDTVGDSKYKQGNLLQSLAASSYRQILDEKNQNIDLYKKHAFQSEDIEGTSQDYRLQALRNEIEKLNRDSYTKLNQLLLDEFSTKLGIKYEQAQLKGKAKKRVLTIEDIKALKPFHWGYHFDQIIEERGGFDAIITNPPWEVFKPNAREFFVQHNELVKKSKMDIKQFEKAKSKLLENPEIAAAWLDYQSQFPYVSAYYRSSEQYKNQISIVNGRKSGTDINLYKLFLEQCFNLLHSGGCCGIILPTGIYTDLGAKQLREMLFTQSELGALFGLSNERFVFEGVDHRFKFCLLDFEKGSKTDSFGAAFRINPREAIKPEKLNIFLNDKDEHIKISVSLIRQLSPDSLSVMEFKNDTDIRIAQKMSKFPLLGEKIPGKWNLKLTREFDMTNDSHLFNPQPAAGRLPLYEGKMIHQFTHQYAEPRYWIDEEEARVKLLGRGKEEKEQNLDYQNYRLGFRTIGRASDIRTLIVSLIHQNAFCGNSILVSSTKDSELDKLSNSELLAALTIFNSFALDFYIRQMVSANINMFYIYQLPIPRLTEGEPYFNEIVEHAAKLICTTPEFDDLAQEVGLGSHKNGVTDETERAKLRAELDGMIAHLYNLTEAEFKHILSTFPIVPEETKQAALDAYKAFTPLTSDAEIIDLINQGESTELEFKSSSRWDMRENNKNKAMEQVILKTVAAFLNTHHGGTLLIGVNDEGKVIGLNHDYQTLQKKNRDGYELFLTNDLLLKELGKDIAPYIHITFHEIEGKDVCRISLDPSPRPVYVKLKDAKSGQTKECLFIRTGNLTSQLDTPSEILNYCQNRWNSSSRHID